MTRSCTRSSLPRPLLVGIAVLLAALLPGSATPTLAQQIPEFRLDTVRVEVGSRTSEGLPLRTRAVEILDRDQIARLPARTLPEVLRWTTGVDLQSRSPVSHDLALRGGGFEEVLVLVDGVRVSDAQTGHYDLDLTVLLDQVERIEILRGPASALYGTDAVGGVVNVVTRDSPSWSSRVEGGSFGSWGVAVTGGHVMADSGTRLSFGAGTGRSDGHRPGTDHDERLVQGSIRTPFRGGEMRLDAGAAWRDFGATFFYANNPAWDEFERTRTQTLTAGWASGAAAGNGVRWEPQLSIRRHEDTFLLIRNDPGFYRNRHVGWQVGGELNVRSSHGGSLQMAAGIEAHADLLRSNNLGNRQEGRGGVSGELVWSPDARTALQAGLRGDVHDRWGGVLSPSAAAAVVITDQVKLRAGAGHSFRAPTFTDRYYVDPANAGNPDLRPEHAWTLEGGADWSPLPGARIAVTGFVRYSRDLIDWARPVGAGDDTPWVTRNVDRTRVRGVEMDGAFQGPLGLEWTAGATVLSLRVDGSDGPFISRTTLRPLTQNIRLGTAGAVGPVRVSVLGSRGVRAEGRAWHLLDSRLTTRLPFPGELFLDVTNLGDEDYPDITGQRAPGRQVTLGFRVGG